jgi:hypothetical protein
MNSAVAVTTRIDKSTLTSAQQLILELLAAQWRLGEPAWVFPGKARQSLEVLQGKGLLWWQPGSAPGTLLASLTEAGREVTLDGVYDDPAPPLVAEIRRRTADLNRMIAGLEFYIDRQARRITAAVHVDAGQQIAAAQSAANAQLNAADAQLAAADARILAMREESDARADTALTEINRQDALITELRQRLAAAERQLASARAGFRRRDGDFITASRDPDRELGLDSGDDDGDVDGQHRDGNGLLGAPRPADEQSSGAPARDRRWLRSRAAAG